MNVKLLRAVALAAAAFATVSAARADDVSIHGSLNANINAGIDVHAQASLAEIGLPAYPGATLVVDRQHRRDGGNVSLSLWGGEFGMKLNVAKFQTGDSIDAVQAFYRDALARYGQVVDCGGMSVSASASDSRTELRLGCDKNERGPEHHVLKVGASDHNFRLVALKQEGRQVTIDLVRLVIKGD